VYNELVLIHQKNSMNKAKQKPEGDANRNTDLSDSIRDEKELQNEEATLDLPDVKDIPGQEHVHPPKMREYYDTTASSADEEGENIWIDDEITEDSSNVSDLEKEMLDETANDMPTKDELALRQASLDSTDSDGEPLNEKVSSNAISGSDLDVPGASDDDPDEETGEEDEENNPYSLGGDDNYSNEERSGV
jgi:hypothetical protein